MGTFRALKAGFGQDDWKKADGMIAALLALRFSQIEIKVLLKVGSYRVDRIKKEIEDKINNIIPPVRIKPAHAISDNLIDAIKKNILSLEYEEGFSCSHRHQKMYLTEPGITWKTIYLRFIAECKKLEIRSISYACWLKKVKEMFPHLRLHVLKEDECNTCFELKTKLMDKSLDQDQRNEIVRKLDLHVNEAKQQRAEMNSVLRSVCISLSGEELPGYSNILPLYKDSSIEYSDSNELTLVKNGFIVQAEDFGGAIPLPIYQNRRPAASFFASSIMINNFVVACPSINRNFVFVFDERSQDRDSDAMCGLRLVYHLKMHLLHKQNGLLLLKSLSILDNCVAQNKSQNVFMFFACLQILFYPNGLHLLFLKPGHSHMVADRIVGQCRQSIKGFDIFHPSQLVDCFNARKTIEATFIDHLKDENNNNDCLYLNKEICVRKHRLAFRPSLRVDFIPVHLA